MENYRCFGCDHECRIDTGSMYGSPVKCVVTGTDVEWAKVTEDQEIYKDIKSIVKIAPKQMAIKRLLLRFKKWANRDGGYWY